MKSHSQFDGYTGPWKDIENGKAEPDEYKAHILECTAAIYPHAARYNVDVGPKVSALMAERFGYPELQADPKAEYGLTSRDFGSHVYMAQGVVRARKTASENREAAATFHAGQTFKRLVLSDLKQVTGATLTEIDPDGKVCKMVGKRGKNAVSWTCTAAGLVAALERVESRDARRAGAPIPGSTTANGIMSVTIDLGAGPAPMSQRLAALSRAAA